MKKWEYKTFEWPLTNKELNKLGEEGWEFVSHTAAVSNWILGACDLVQYYVFKREKNGS